MIIGLTGKNGAGKGEVAKFLQSRGFHYYSLSDMLREEAARREMAVTRDNLVSLGNQLRATLGPGVLAEKVIARLDPEKNYVIDSVRHPSEVQVLKRRRDFFLACVDAPAKVRFDRLQDRARESDPTDFKKFEELEKREAASGKESDQQLDQAIQLADVTVDNSGPLDDLHIRIRDVILSLSRKQPRPDWDEYFMGIAKVAALRSNCIARKVAAVIVKDKRIISTGYNGTPRGIQNCSEGGCPRCNAIGVSGKSLDECLCSHAEENAIVQSAYHGVNISGAVIYTTFSPCLTCTKMIINAGLKEVVYNIEYPLGETSLKLLEHAHVIIRRLKVDTPV